MKTTGIHLVVKALTYLKVQTAEILKDRHFFQPSSFVSWCHAR